MKKIVSYLSVFLILFGCIEDDVLDQPLISYHPDLALNAVEDDGVTYTVRLISSRILQGESQVTIEVVNGDFLDITPAPSGNQITLNMSAGDDFVSFTVKAGDDNLPSSYEALFKVVKVSGSLKAVSRNNTFTLFVKDDDQEVIFEDDFESRNLDKWTTFDAGGSNNWGTGDFSSNYYAVCSNFLSSAPADDWLISPEINFDDYAAERLTFQTLTAFNNGNVLEVAILTNYSGGDPSQATKIQLSPELDPHQGAGFGDFTPSGEVDLSAVTGVGNIAFHFKAIDEQDGAQWQVDDVILSGVNLSGGGGGGGGGGGSGSTFSVPFSDDFEDCTQDFVTPANFIEAFVAGSKTDRGWGCRQEGVGGGRAVRASAFGGDPGTDNAWLITNKPFDLVGLGEAWLRFDAKSQFDGDGTLKVLWSDDYPGSGDPSASTWTELTDAPAQLPTKGSGSYVEVISDWSSATGSEVYLAFQWEGGSDGNSASYEIDNIDVTENEPTGGGGGGGGGGGSGPFTLPFVDDFEDCTTDFVTPPNFIEEFVPGSKTDRGWGCRADGVGGSRGVRASAFGGSPGTDNAWLISNDVFDLTGVASAFIKFDAKSQFDGDGTLKVLWSDDYSGSGDPSASTWTELTDLAAQLPGKGTATFVEVSLDWSSAAGNSVYLAFQWEGGANDNSASYEIDNIEITETP